MKPTNYIVNIFQSKIRHYKGNHYTFFQRVQKVVIKKKTINRLVYEMFLKLYLQDAPEDQKIFKPFDPSYQRKTFRSNKKKQKQRSFHF